MVHKNCVDCYKFDCGQNFMRVKRGAGADSVFGICDPREKPQSVIYAKDMGSSEALGLTSERQGSALVFDSCPRAIYQIPSAVHDAAGGRFEPCDLTILNTPIAASALNRQLRIALGFAEPGVRMAIRVMDVYPDSRQSIGMIRETIAEFERRSPGIRFELQSWPDRRSLVPRPDGPSLDEAVLKDVLSSLAIPTAEGSV